MNFKKTLLISLIPVLFTSEVWAQKTSGLAEVVKQQLLDSLGKVLNRNYVYPDTAVVMISSILQKHRNQGYNDINEARQFANQVTKDVKTVFNDNHLSVRFDPDLEKRIRAFEATRQKDQSDFVKEKAQNFFFRKAEILKGNIGYVVFTNFADTNALSRKTVHAAFQFIANTDALILDLRNNFGGRGTMAKEITAYFFDKPQLTGRSFNRIHNKWTEDWVGGQPAITRDVYLTMPIYILTSERTFSAAEGLAYNLKHLKNAVIVGDTTRGGAHSTRSFALGNGFVGFIPFSRGGHIVTKTDWEGTGVIPNVPIKEERSLFKAQELILKNKLAVASDTTEKLKLQWLVNDLYSKVEKVILPEKILNQYTGVFEEFLFTLECGVLYCRNTHQQDKKDKLVAINEHLFKIDEQSQVEFITGKNGTVNSIRLLWDDGWVDTITKSK
jgi:C-terminal processing protease CtpA/Prc